MTETMGQYLAESTPKERGYTEEDISRGLNALIAFGGSSTAAAKALKQAFDLDIPRHTLDRWRTATHVERYVELQRRHEKDIEQAMVRDTRDLARAAGLAERMAVEKVIDHLENGRMDSAQASQAALNMSKVKQSNIDKMLALTGRPQQITENRSATELLRALEAKGVLTVAAD